MKISDVLRKLADKIDGAEGIPDAPGNTEPDAVNTQSPVVGFKGYPR